ncbi:MAG: IS630 family transposase [Proteobacteria bacterium]|nr:IS630 family transposase [Pseudomonadota bacterium]
MAKKSVDGRSLSREALEAFRLRAIELRYELGYSVTEIASIFGLHYNSVSRWFCRHRKDGVESLRRTTAPGAETLLNDRIVKWLEKALLKPATEWGYSTSLWTVSMLRALLRDQKGIEVHRVTVWRYLRRIGLTWQKPERRYLEQKQELVDEWLKKEWPRIQKWVGKTRAILYFEDESGVCLAPVTGKTWAKRGKTPIVRVTGKRGGITAISAVSLSGHLRFRLVKCRVNSAVIIDFLRQILRSHKRRKIGVVMDQAPCHKSKKVQDFVKDQKRLEVFYIPPYSPELNPDEKVWKHLKHRELKEYSAKNKSELSKAVLSALHSMQKRPALLTSFFDEDS